MKLGSARARPLHRCCRRLTADGKADLVNEQQDTLNTTAIKDIMYSVRSSIPE